MKVNDYTNISIRPSVFYQTGHRYGLIMDIDSNRYQQVPIGLIKLLESIDNEKTISDILISHKSKKNIITDYLTFLISKNWLHKNHKNIKSRKIKTNLSTFKKTKVKFFSIECFNFTNQDYIVELFYVIRKEFFCNEINFIVKQWSDSLGKSLMYFLEMSKRVGFHKIYITFIEPKNKTIDILKKVNNTIIVHDSSERTNELFYKSLNEINAKTIVDFRSFFVMSTRTHCFQIPIQA